jgi:hypothetical protein
MSATNTVRPDQFRPDQVPLNNWKSRIRTSSEKAIQQIVMMATPVIATVAGQ